MDYAPYDLQITFVPGLSYSWSTTTFEIFDSGGLGNAELIARIKKFLMLAKLKNG